MVDSLVVITDADPSLDASEEDEDEDDSATDNRAERLRGIATELGAGERLTVGEATYTLEADLLIEPTNVAVISEAYLKQHPRSAHKWDEITAAPDPAEALYRRLRKDKQFISKGEFAHDVAVAVQDGQPFVVPGYLREAITAALAEPGESGATAGTD